MHQFCDRVINEETIKFMDCDLFNMSFFDGKIFMCRTSDSIINGGDFQKGMIENSVIKSGDFWHVKIRLSDVQGGNIEDG
jgi:hypothetical protein